jgi:hypothetical protein
MYIYVCIVCFMQVYKYMYCIASDDMVMINK